MPRSFGASPRSSRANSPARRPNVGRAAPSTFELSGSTQRAEGSRAERRYIETSFLLNIEIENVQVRRIEPTWFRGLPATFRG